MKAYLPVLLVLSQSLTATEGFADGGSGSVGNGGGAHVCYSDGAMTNFTSAEVYDLWEGRDDPRGRHLEIPEWDGISTRDEIVERVLQKISKTQPGVAREMRKSLDFLYTPGTLMDASKLTLVTVADARLLYTAKLCRYEQVVNWLSAEDPTKDQVLRDEAFYRRRFNPLNQAALDIHEAAYAVYRQFSGRQVIHGATEVRKFVAEAFSSGPIHMKMAPTELIDYGVYLTTDFPRATVRIVADPKQCDWHDVTVTRKYVSGAESHRKGTRKISYTDEVWDAHEYLFPGQSRTDRLHSFTNATQKASGVFSLNVHHEKWFREVLVRFTVEGCGIPKQVLETVIVKNEELFERQRRDSSFYATVYVYVQHFANE